MKIDLNQTELNYLNILLLQNKAKLWEERKETMKKMKLPEHTILAEKNRFMTMTNRDDLVADGIVNNLLIKFSGKE